MNTEVATYRKHMNLKLAAQELGIAWQTLYVRLKKAGEPVVGDKLRYGSDKDKLAAKAEQEFHALVPFATSTNEKKFQSKYDFDVCGFKIDVKAARKAQKHKLYAALSWSFSFKKQTLVCDFICCFCIGDNGETEKVLLVPSEFFRGIQTVTVSCAGGSKWLDYEVPQKDLASFFTELAQKDSF